MFKVWLEWDFGQDDCVFSTKDKAIQWVNEAIKLDSLNEEFPNGYNDLWDAGYVDISELTVDP